MIFKLLLTSVLVLGITGIIDNLLSFYLSEQIEKILAYSYLLSTSSFFLCALVLIWRE